MLTKPAGTSDVYNSKHSRVFLGFFQRAKRGEGVEIFNDTRSPNRHLGQKQACTRQAGRDMPYKVKYNQVTPWFKIMTSSESNLIPGNR